MKKVLYISLTIFLSCSGEKTGAIKTTNSTPKTHNRLINCTSEFIMEDGEHATPFYTEHEKFITEYYSEYYTEDTIVVSSLLEINSCAQILGDVEISNDTIKLITKQISDEACGSVVFHKFTYTIYNPDNLKYKIISQNKYNSKQLIIQTANCVPFQFRQNLSN